MVSVSKWRLKESANPNFYDNYHQFHNLSVFSAALAVCSQVLSSYNWNCVNDTIPIGCWRVLPRQHRSSVLRFINYCNRLKVCSCLNIWFWCMWLVSWSGTTIDKTLINEILNFRAYRKLMIGKCYRRKIRRLISVKYFISETFKANNPYHKL